MVTELNLSSPTSKANPYPAFAQWRNEDPIHYTRLSDKQQGWVITRYEDADFVLRDPRFVKDSRNALTPEEIQEQFPWFSEQTDNQKQTFHLNRNMLGYDPPDHTRLRTLINMSFTPRLIEQWRARIQEIADELLDNIQDQTQVDLIDTFAFPLPMMVITELLGIPGEDRLKFRAWSNTIIDAAGNAQEFERRQGQIIEFRTYLLGIIKEKRNHPSNDLLSQLIQAEAEGDKLTEGELVATVSLLLIAGHETTVNLIGNGTLALLLHHDQMEKLQNDPELLRSAVEEFLRFHGPLMTATQRWAKEDVEINGIVIHRGDYVLVVLASANHDPNVFAEADELDITRHDNHHLAFGKGIHYCLGAPLARLEGQIAIGTLLRRMPKLRLSVEPQDLIWRPGTLIMGLRTLPVNF